MTASDFFLRRLIKWSFWLSMMAGAPIGAYAYGNEAPILPVNDYMEEARIRISNLGAQIESFLPPQDDWLNTILNASNQVMDQKGTDSILAKLRSKINEFD